MATESLWQRGLSESADKEKASSNELLGFDMNFAQDSWDDSAILDIFDDAIKSHRMKKEKVDTRSHETSLLSCPFFL